MRNAQPLAGIAREGWPALSVAIIAVVAAAATGHPLPAAVAGALGLLLAAFFREPERELPAAPGVVYAPVSGRLLSVRRVDKGPLETPALRLRIVVSPFGGYSVRSPVDALVREARCSGDPPVYWLQTVSGDDILLLPRRNLFWRASLVRVAFGQRVGQARRIGVRRGLVVLDVYLPPAVGKVAAAGSWLRAGRSALAELS